MCGRYGRFSRKERIEAVLEHAIVGGDELAPRYNVCPGLPDWIIRQSYRTRELRFEQFQWGLLPSWTKNPTSARRPINARAETLAERPMFRDLLRSRRCVVPIDGYYEWRATSSGKVPFWFSQKSGEPFFLAGLWDRWHGGQPDAVASYILMTTEPTTTDAAMLTKLLRPYPASEMESRPVSRRVSSPDSEGPDLIRRDDSIPELW